VPQFERVYVGEEDRFVPDLPGGVKQPVSPGDTVVFPSEPNSPLFVTAGEAKKLGVKPRPPQDAAPPLDAAPVDGPDEKQES